MTIKEKMKLEKCITELVQHLDVNTALDIADVLESLITRFGEGDPGHARDFLKGHILPSDERLAQLLMIAHLGAMVVAAHAADTSPYNQATWQDRMRRLSDLTASERND